MAAKGRNPLVASGLWRTSPLLTKTKRLIVSTVRGWAGGNFGVKATLAVLRPRLIAARVPTCAGALLWISHVLQRRCALSPFKTRAVQSAHPHRAPATWKKVAGGVTLVSHTVAVLLL